MMARRVLIAALISFLFPSWARAADRYWVGGTGNWSDATNHWATGSGGAPGAGNLPTAADNAIFNASSNTSNAAYTVTVNATAVCNDLNFSAKPGDGLGGTITWAGNSTLTISGSMTLLSGMTISSTGTIVFNATSTGKTINTNGVSIATPTAVTFNGVGGEWTLLSNTTFAGSSGVTLTNGALIVGAHTLQTRRFSSNNANARTFDLRGGTHSFLGSGAPFDVSSSLTLLVDTSSVINNPSTFDGGGLTYNDVNFTVITQTSVTGTNTFRNVTISGGGVFLLYADQNITGTFTTTGTSVSSRVVVQSDTMGTAQTITAATVSLTDVDFRDITAAGAAINWTGTRLGNRGGNTNITFAAANKYYVGNTGVWNGAVWATSSGGAGSANNFPLPQDTAIFDANSFSANSQTLTINAAYGLPSLNFSAITKTGITLAGGVFHATLFGDVTLEANMVVTGTGIYTWSRNNTQLLTSAGVSWTQRHTIDSQGGTLKLMDDFTTSNLANLTSGTLDLNGHVFTATQWASSNSNARTIMDSTGGGKLKTTDTAVVFVFNMGLSTNAVIDRTNAWSIEIAGNSTNTRTFSGGGRTWPALIFSNTTTGGNLNFLGSNTFKSIAVSTPPQTLRFTAATTTTIEDDTGFPSGTAGNLITVGSITAAGHTLAKSGTGKICNDYLSLSRSTASPTNRWYAGSHSTNGSNNQGWMFAPCSTARRQFGPFFQR